MHKIQTLKNIKNNNDDKSSLKTKRKTYNKRFSFKSIDLNSFKEINNFENEYKHFYQRNYNYNYLDEEVYKYLINNHKNLIETDLKIKPQKSTFCKKNIKKNKESILEIKKKSVLKNFQINNAKKNKNNRFLNKFIFAQLFIIINDFIQVIFSIASSISYILLTIYDPTINNKKNDNSNNNYQNLINNINIFEYVIMAFVTLDFIINLYKEKNHLIIFFFKIMTIIDFTTIAIFYLSLFSILRNQFGFLHILQIFRMLRIFKIFRVFNDYSFNRDNPKDLNNPIYAFYKQITETLITLVIIVFIYSSIFFELNSFTELFKFYDLEDNYLTFFNIVYIILLYWFTWGFSDMFPKNILSRFLFIILFFNFYIILIYDIYKINLIKKRVYNYSKNSNWKDHYIIYGFFEFKTLKRMINGIKKIDKNSKILIASQKKFDTELLEKIKQNFQLSKIKLIYKEDIFDLFNNGNFQKCKSVFILNNHYNIKKKDSIDRFISFFCKNIHDYYNNINLKIQIFEEKDKNLLNIYTEWSPLIDIFSTNQIKISLIVNSIFNSGLIAFFNNLLFDNDSDFTDDIEEYKEFIFEYKFNFKQNIHFFKLNYIMVNYTFKELNFYFFNQNIKNGDGIIEYGVILIGIKTFIDNYKGEILINPINYKINEGDIGIFIYHNKKDIIYLIENFDIQNNVTNEYKNRNLSKSKNILVFEKNDINICKLNNEIKNIFVKINQNIENYFCNLKNDKIYKLFKDDLNKLVNNHIIIFGPLEYLENTIKIIREKTMKPICYFNNKKVSKEFEKIKKKKQNVFYFQGDFFSINDLNNSGIKNCFYVIIYSENNENSIFNDSNSLFLINILKKNFPNTNYIYEIYNKKMLEILENYENSYLIWDEFTNSKIFFNSFLDKIILASVKNKNLCDFIDQIFKNNNNFNNKFIENKQFYIIDVPEILINFNFQYIYNYFITQTKYLMIVTGIIIKKDQNFIITNPSKSKIIKQNYKLILLGNFNLDIYKRNYNFCKIFNDKKFEEGKELINLLKKQLKIQKIKNKIIKKTRQFLN